MLQKQSGFDTRKMSGTIVDSRNNPYEIKHISLNPSEAGDNLIVEGSSNKKIRVIKYKVWISDDVQYFFKGGDVAISSVTGSSYADESEHGVFSDVPKGEDLFINLSGNVLVGVDISYIEVVG